MNIKEAKQEIKNAITAYFTKDEFGNYIIPIEKQRPVFLSGAPGIGKTAIMEQIAEELDVAFVPYSMTHHTRQSALGLPFIEKKIYDGREYSISEYTMSEIIASVYEQMRLTGKREGILFLDEINCVSETLAPAMLEFLQYKVFGRHRVPDGWIVVTAGNPPEYNNSVREFDIVTWDRLKRIDVEPDYSVWREYAYKKGIHQSIITYLDIENSDFYKVESTVDGKQFVTARGWSDLSDMIKLYEMHSTTHPEMKVDRNLVAQYLQNSKTAKKFANYYELFKKYRSDYHIEEILGGNASHQIKLRAINANFDERLALIGLLMDSLTNKFYRLYLFEQVLTETVASLRRIKAKLDFENASDLVKSEIQGIFSRLSIEKQSSSLTKDKSYIYNSTVRMLDEIGNILQKNGIYGGAEALSIMQAEFGRHKDLFYEDVKDVGDNLSNMFKFCSEVFGDESNEMVIVVGDITINYYGQKYISQYGCQEYISRSKTLSFNERIVEIKNQINMLTI